MTENHTSFARPRGPGLATALFLLLGVALSGCMGPPHIVRPGMGDSDTGSGLFVSIRDFRFDPPTLNVGVGDTVRWTNEDLVGHTVTPVDEGEWGTAGSGASPAQWLMKGDSWSFTFLRPGTYEYYCSPHPYMTGTILVGESEGVPINVSERVVPSPLAPPPTQRSTPAHVRIDLETIEKTAQLADGVAYEFWTFNGTVPGPMLRVRVGDSVDLMLKNSPTSKNPHSIDLHAVTGPGGGAGVTQTPPGSTTSFSFLANNPGLYVYHCASPHIPSHVANGMYGLILVEPEEPLPSVDREYFVVQGEVYTEGRVGQKGLQPFSHEKMLDERAEYFLFNGRVGALAGDGALRANVNETVRLYVGVGGFVPSSFHVIGEIFDRVYPEGSLESPHSHVQTTLIPAGGAAIVEFQVDVPGNYLLVDHWLTHAIDRGAAGVLQVEGPPNPEMFRGGAGSGH